MKSAELKICALVIYRYRTNLMWTLRMLTHVSGYCAFRIWKCLRPKEATDIYHFCFNVQLNFLRKGLSEPEFYGSLVYKLKKVVGSNKFSAQFIKIISHYKKIGYSMNVLHQNACFVVNLITVGNFAFLFNCTPVGQTSESMTVPT